MNRQCPGGFLLRDAGRTARGRRGGLELRL